MAKHIINITVFEEIVAAGDGGCIARRRPHPDAFSRMYRIDAADVRVLDWQQVLPDDQIIAMGFRMPFSSFVRVPAPGESWHHWNLIRPMLEAAA